MRAAKANVPCSIPRVNSYKRPEDSVLAAGCQLTLVFAFVGATYIRLFNEIELLTSNAVASRVMVFTSTTVIAMPLVFVTLAAAVMMLWIMVHVLRAQEDLPSVRLSSTKMPPELTMERCMVWHLFLSHIVSSVIDVHCS